MCKFTNFSTLINPGCIEVGLEERSAEQERRQQFPKLSREMPEQNERMKLKALCNKEEDKGLK